MAEKGKRRGRFLQHGERQGTLRQMLLGHYQNNPQFITYFSRVMDCHEQLLCSERKRLVAAGTGVFQSALPAPDYKADEERFRPLLDDLKALASRWGLLCDWAVPTLRESARFSTLFPRIGPLLVADIILPLPRDVFGHRIKLDLPYNALDEWKTWVKNVLEPEVIRQRDEIEGGLLQVSLGRKYDTEPLLERDIRWLYERIALKLTPRRKAQALARGEGVPEDLKTYAKASAAAFELTYSDAIRRRARELGISLRQGRPRKDA